MGIFDDAIREHLDLKRRQGADESELQQLEDEAFGLPARPGDPDFPETGESQAAPEGPPGASEASAETGSAPSGEVQTAEEPVAEAPPADEGPPHGDSLLADPEAEPPLPPQDALVEDEAAPSFSTTEREAIADQPTEFFDQTPEPLDLGELDLDLKDELDDVGTLEDEPLTGEEEVEQAAEADEPPPVDEPTPVDEAKPVGEPTPVEEIEVVEETEPASETDLSVEPEEPAADAPAEGEGETEGEGEADGEDADAEDVLEETPEFLRDNPDDDELWFEQGEPKDFDF